jgi:hypothetical protein
MWSDRETSDDCLGFSSYVESLADVCLEAEIAPLTVGVFGSWGSGKTSLMQMLRAAIDARADQAATSGAPKIITLWFNAWRYEGKEEIQSALIHAILRELEKDKSLVQDMKDTFDRLKKGASVLKLAKTIAKSAITLTPDFTGLLDAFSDESEKVADTMERFESDFESLFLSGKVGRIIVFIDDLDRCSSDKVVEAFETIKLFLNTPETTFVIGADAAKIEEAISSVYRVERDRKAIYSRDYLEKIVQLPFSIPEQRRNDVEAYVAMLVLRGYTTPDGWKRLLTARRDILDAGSDTCAAFTEWVGKNVAMLRADATATATAHLARALGTTDVLVRGLRGNPRQIKRFLNILELRGRIATANKLHVSADFLTKMTALEYSWPEFFAQVVETAAPDGTSELLAELTKYADRAEKPSEDSPMLSAALDEPGLAEFIAAKPAIDAATDLSPYLFLAQTSLDPKRRPALLPHDEWRATSRSVLRPMIPSARALRRSRHRSRKSVWYPPSCGWSAQRSRRWTATSRSARVSMHCKGSKRSAKPSPNTTERPWWRSKPPTSKMQVSLPALRGSSKPPRKRASPKRPMSWRCTPPDRCSNRRAARPHEDSDDGNLSKLRHTGRRRVD